MPPEWLLPAFVESHAHVLPTGLDLGKPSLLGVSDKSEALERVADASRQRPDGWLHVVQTDPNLWGGDLPTRAELDAIRPHAPLLLRHSNGHASYANSAALRAARVAEDAPDPDGGAFGRDASGRLNGLLDEAAHELVTDAMPVPTEDEMVAAIRLAADSWRAMGVVAAADLMTGRFDLARELAAYERAGFPVRLYVEWDHVFGGRPFAGHPLVAGVKLFADGAIGSATAALREPYASDPANFGTLVYPPDELKRRVRVAAEAGHAVAVHAIGDRATDLVLNAFEATPEPHRHRLEHAMLLDDAQIRRIASLGVETTFQPEFLARFGAGYRRHLGPERAARLIPAASALAAGVRVSFSSDRPIVPGDPWDGVLAAERREGFDPAERVPREVGVRLYTEAARRVMGLPTGPQRAVYAEDPMTAERPRVVALR